MAIKLIALDIDGTLTSGFTSISKKNLDAVHRAQAAGIFVTVATGRGYLGSKMIIKALGIEGPVIHYGGALMMDSRTDSQIYAETLSSEAVSAALEFANEIQVHIHLYQGDTVICESDDAFLQRYTDRLALPKRIDPDIRARCWNHVPKLLAYVDENEDEVRAKFSERLSGLAGVSKTERGFIEINCASASKGRALSVLAERLSISRAETAAIGDSYLDLSMIEWAGDGVAVENALESVKHSANRVVPACNDDGVAYYIERIALNT